MDWTSGYRADIDYTHGYYRELSTALIDFALLQRGFEPPVREGPVRYLELGFGQGVTLNIQAAAAAGEYWGTDFNPVHANHAQILARASGADLKVFDDSFDELLAREDLPKFDYIILHGVWTWVSNENRRVIVDILRNRLKVGGAVYFSYNCLPGWASSMPLRNLMSLHVEAAGERANIDSRIGEALAFAAKLVEQNAAYFLANPYAKTRLEGLQGQSRNYLAHEYLNDAWTPMYFSELQEWLSEAKLTFAAAASSMDNIDGFVLSVPQREMLASLPSDALRESVRDYMLNTQFRRDLYVRGARRLSFQECNERILNQRLILLADPSKVVQEAQVGHTKVQFNPDIYAPIIRAMAANGGGPKRLSDLAKDSKIAELPQGALIEACQALVGVGQMHPVQEDDSIEAAQPACDRLNTHLCRAAVYAGDINTLASPVLGGGIAVSRFEQLFLISRAEGAKTPKAWAESVWKVLESQGSSIIQEGRVLTTAEENLAFLLAEAQSFETHRLPLLRRLGVAA